MRFPTFLALSAGRTPAMTFPLPIPTVAATASAVARLSPVTIHTLIPILLQASGQVQDKTLFLSNHHQDSPLCITDRQSIEWQRVPTTCRANRSKAHPYHIIKSNLLHHTYRPFGSPAQEQDCSDLASPLTYFSGERHFTTTIVTCAKHGQLLLLPASLCQPLPESPPLRSQQQRKPPFSLATPAKRRSPLALGGWKFGGVLTTRGCRRG